MDPINHSQVNHDSPPAVPKGVLTLRKDVRFVPQHSSDTWHCVAEDPVAKKFYRIGRLEYLIASALDGKHDLTMIVELISFTHPKLHVDAASVERSIKWLMNSGLATLGPPPEHDGTEQRSAPQASAQPPSGTAKGRKPKDFQVPVDPFSFRFPLIGGAWIEKLAYKIQWLCHVPSMIGGVVIIMTAAMMFLANSTFFTELGAKLFVPEAALWWAAAWFLLKFVHELGHATFCVAKGAKIRGAGIAFFYLAPMPYIDTTDMWRLPTPRSRALCAAGGMWFELLLACLALILCRWLENQTLQYFCIALATLGTFTTLAFNANPLVRFDGYFILSDTLNRPTLWTEGQEAWKSIFSGNMRFLSTAVSLHGLPLVLYGGGCFVNRCFMMIGLAWGTWHTWRGVGLLMIALASYLWFISPYLKKQRQLLAIGQPAFQLPSRRKLTLSAVTLGAIIVASYFVPSPWQPQVPGILSYGDPAVIRPTVDGFIAKVFIDDNRYLEAGTPIVVFENKSLALMRATVRLQLESSRERCLVLRAQSKIAEMQAEQAKVDSLEAQLNQLDLQSEQMIIKAPINGRLIARQLSRQVGQFVKAGQALGMIVPSKEVEVSCTIAQEDIEQYRASINQSVVIYLQGIGKVLGRIKEVKPRGLDTLESPVLAAKYGGPIAVHCVSKEVDNKDPMRTNKPRFIGTIVIDSASLETSKSQQLIAGQLCRIQLIDSHITLANAINRWTEAFVNWVKPPQVDVPS